MQTILHAYHPKRSLLLLEYINTSNTKTTTERSSTQNTLLFVGGLYDNFRWPRYLDDLAALFPRDVPGQNWRVMQVQLSSNGRSWGLFDLDRDVEEMEAAISYIRSNITTTQPSHIVLMGHSTGCQDLMHYLLSPTGSPRPSISGAVFQAPVSDREAILHEVETSEAARNAYETALSICSDTPVAKHKSMILPLDVMTPLFGPAPVSVSRFLSLASPDSPGTPSMDDYFSSDLLDERLAETFGRVGSLTHLLPSQAGTGTKSILMLHGTEDKSVPSHIDKASLISRWKDFLSKGGARLDPNTAIIEHANHDISGETVEVREARLVKMRSAVLHYLDDRVGGVGEGAHAVWKGDADAIKEEGYAKRLERRTSVDDSKL